jgi:soluble lytic murein transglycosylase-like protein
VSRCRTWIAIVALLIIATALATIALPQKAEASSLRGQLRAARLALRDSRHRLKEAQAALSAALLTSDGTVTALADAAASSAAPTTTAVSDLKARVRQARRAVRRWRQRVHRIARQYRLERNLAEWELHAKWMPIIEVAAAKYHVKADGIYRMMMRESGGRRTAGSDSAYKGLFQYWTGTWSASWNPWRGDSIYDGSSQIFATCFAVSRGMGPQMWTTTFSSQY